MKIVEAIVDDLGIVRLLESVQLPPGQRVLVTVLEDPAPEHAIGRLEGCIPYSGPPVSIEQMDQAVLEESAAK